MTRLLPYHIVISSELTFNTDYTAITGVTGATGVTTDGEYYMEVSFDNTASLAANSESGPVQMRLHHSGYQTQDQSNDFSYDQGKSSFKPHIQTTLYYQGQLVWGLEPGNSTPVNSKPQIVIATSSLTGNAPLLTTFDARQSSDVDGTITNFSWDFGDGNTSNTAQTSNTYAVPGSYQVTLLVTDNEGTTATKTLDVLVTDPTVNNAPVANIVTSTTTGTVPLSVSFDGSGSYDLDNDVLSYIWDFGDGTSDTGVLTNHSYTMAGTYDVILTVDDGNGGIGSEIIQITSTEIDINTSPVAMFTTSVIEGYAPLSIMFDASSSTDADGDLLTYTWDFGDNTTDVGVTSSHTFTAAGDYTVQLTVFDSNGGSDSTITIITVTDEIGTVPNDCNFGTPIVSALPTFDNISYDYVYVLGSGGPDLSNVTNFSLNWNQANNSLYQLSISTNDGQPSWWNDLIPSATHTFGNTSPELTLTGTGFIGLDGTYYVNQIESDFQYLNLSDFDQK